ncbi:hypothetical protein A9257_05225 [Vibrio cyclitrophicus]|uniref:hypothetical protein n=1 Tax=Vibrio cyclitrophicus TaxID=47951 RepID=UPI0007EED846|nr:hypothetical protein [Vibrio cyclitrophicus]OBT05136.1 hypothetical protein A9257_05225 [Vibrio cyclitrophicus]
MKLDIFLSGTRLEECDWLMSEYEAYLENEYRIELLRKMAAHVHGSLGRRYSCGRLHALADKLEDCNEGLYECKSVACKKCNRQFKIERVNNIIASILLDQEQIQNVEYGVYTIIQYSRGVDAYDFVDYDIPRDKDRLRKLLSRCGIDGPVLGSFELDFHCSPQKWLPHYHVLMRKSGNEEAIERLSEKLTKLHPKHIKQNRQARPFMKQEFRDPLKQLSYIHKLACFEVRDYQSFWGKNLTKKYRLNKLMFCESLCWLDEQDRRTLPFQWHAREWLKQSKV